MTGNKTPISWLLIAGGTVIALATFYWSAGSRLQPAAGQADAEQTANANQPAAPAIQKTQVNYQCDNQQIVLATYMQGENIAPKVQLVINGQAYELYSVPATVGELYATEQGIFPEQGMRWHVQGLETRLTRMVLDHTAVPGQGELIMRCQQPV